MRISDWSSDVCSSDLATKLRSRPAKRAGVGLAPVEAFSRLTGLDSRLLAMMAALVVIWNVLALWNGGLFLTPANLFNLAVQGSAVGIMATGLEIGRASARERVCKYVEISLVAGP